MVDFLIRRILGAASTADSGRPNGSTKIARGVYLQDENTIRVVNGVARRLASGEWKLYPYRKV